MSLEKFVELRAAVRRELEKRISLAKEVGDISVSSLCRDIEDAGFLLPVAVLVHEIEFPLTAKNPPYQSKVTGGVGRMIHFTPTARVLAYVHGKEAADFCLEHLKKARNIGLREQQLWYVVDHAYGRKEGLELLAGAMGVDNLAYKTLLEEIESGKIPRYHLHPPKK